MTDISAHNLDTYKASRTTRHYAAASHILPSEQAIFSQLHAEFDGRRILDIGCGGGRTTPHLRAISAEYLGIDYSSEMVARSKMRFPLVSFAHGDASDMAEFGAHSFDLVVFSFNGIDGMSQPQRLRTLHEIHRILADDGCFVFSSHNRNRPEIPDAWSTKHLVGLSPIRPYASMRRLLGYAKGILNHRHLEKQQYNGNEFAILNDDAHHYSLLQYYIAIPQQIEQLAKSGFETTGVVDLAGRWLKETAFAACQDTWIYYVCRKHAK